MKKIILLVALLSVMAGSGFAQVFTQKDFLGGNQGVMITNATTVVYGAANVPMISANGSSVYSLTNLYSTNTITAPGNLQTNANVTYGPAWVDVKSVANANGDNASASVALSMVGTGAGSSGTLTFNLVGMAGSTPQGLVNPATSSDSLFSFVITANGTLPVTVITNIPTAKMQGVAGWRLGSVVNSAGAVILKQLSLNSYAQ